MSVYQKIFSGAPYLGAKSGAASMKFTGPAARIAGESGENLTADQRASLGAFMSSEFSRLPGGSLSLPQGEVESGRKLWSELSGSSSAGGLAKQATASQKQAAARRRARASARPLISPDRKSGPTVAPISSSIEDASKLGV